LRFLQFLHNDDRKMREKFRGWRSFMKVTVAGLAALLLACDASFATAGPAVDAATQAESLLAAGKVSEALDALTGALDALCQASPLAFHKSLIVNSSSGYGAYVERADTTFKPDEKMMIYVEPVCFGHADDGAIGFKADLSIENMTGQVLGEAKDVFSLSTPSAPDRREFSMTLAFGVPFLRPGDYKAVFAVHDQNSDKSGTFEVPFAIALPTAN
jgi:hypothetical protein